VRDEAYYFAPQGQTKIMNEGWASYWHSKMMTTNILKDSEIIDYADHHSGTLATSGGQLNPYKLGIELFRDIEDRWNRGRFGKYFDECSDLREKKEWNQDTGLGREKIFEVRKIHNDITFLDEFLTVDFCIDHKLFQFGMNPKTANYEILSRDFTKVKHSLLNALTNRGQPFIFVQDANFENRGDLLLSHRHEGMDLRQDWTRDTLVNIQSIWSRPVHLLTNVEGKAKLLSYDGKEHKDRSMEKDQVTD
jgi:stage V sporulation protein R